ncbi:SipW-dependent-type signal peptide-containing protein [Microbacterium paraoxydans]|jgi:predicted ribosomally synthesized peptide with SipW-like signal peptide|uniref:SipW-cognate class signal peptide n=1 Tax=Microbacterium paraoxydans TaxID=199592 RepID=A0A1H1Q678_9MICO|nr:SipW-dependent-type signal peptide-containing protein [Microbacterium paraoxydans]SDS18489.1 SipW-cognate class signal peptide [Microbacterium paraoxydans]
MRSRRIRAILAGGLVLGVGATATLAAWNDSEHGAATFTAGRFDIVGATDGTTFSSHATAGTAAALNFQLPPTAMAPGTTTYALFSVRTASPSVAGVLQLTPGTPGGTGLATYLTYGVRTITGTSCTAATYPAGTAVVPDGSTLTTAGTTTQAVAANGAAQVNYCFAVTLPTAAGNGAQGLTMTQTWQIQGTSS